MNKTSKYLLVILCVMLGGCEISTPPLPPIDKQSFSYEEFLQQQKQLEQEMQELSPKF